MFDKVYASYALLGLGMLLFFVPISWVQGALSLSVLTAAWVWAMLSRRKLTDRDGLEGSHHRWVGRTYWLFMLYSLIAIIIFGAIFSANGDHSVMQEIANVTQEHGKIHAIEDIQALEEQYQEANKSLLMTLNIAVFGPLFLWMLLRLCRGIIAYKAKTPLKRVKSWL